MDASVEVPFPFSLSPLGAIQLLLKNSITPFALTSHYKKQFLLLNRLRAILEYPQFRQPILILYLVGRWNL